MMRWGDKQVYLCCGSTDIRKSINGLSALVQESFILDPFSGSLYVFCNKPKNRIKILEWDGDGSWLYMKRLEKGRFRWPLITDSPVMALGKDELSYLIEGAKLEKKLKGQEVRERLVS